MLIHQLQQPGVTQYQMMGNKICVRTLDLSGNFAEIRKQLDEIAEKYLLVRAAKE